MKFTDEQLNSFVKLYKKEFNKTLTKEEAQIQARALVGLVKLTYESMTKNEFKKYAP